MDFQAVESLVGKALGQGIDVEDALAILRSGDDRLAAILAGADILRRRQFGGSVRFCSIVNAKSGGCEQDCAFCAQSLHHRTDAPTYDFLDPDKIIAAAKEAKAAGATSFSIVTSGGALEPTDIDSAADCVKRIAWLGLLPCASLGVIGETELMRLKRAGLRKYHHNLEAAPSKYGDICTTRDFSDNVETVRAAQRVGLEVCSGGIFGMGETDEQRVELAAVLRELDIPSIPINFLSPISGTPLEHCSELSPTDCLRIIVMVRFMMPQAHILLAGGRERNLGPLQSLLFFAGASGLMVGNYLTTIGCSPEDDRRLAEALGLTIEEGQ